MRLSERYHPERYRLTRPFARQATTLYQSLTGTLTVPSYDTFKNISSIIINNYNDELSRLPFEQRPSNTKKLVNEQSLAMHYSAWGCHGRQVFHFNDEIAQQFRHTDVDEIQIGLLKFPYNIFYMSFGLQHDLDLDGDGSFVDGAYVSVIPNQLIQIVLTTKKEVVTEGTSSSDWITKKDKYYYLAMSIKDLTQTISSIAEKALNEDIDKGELSLSKATNTINFDGFEIKSRRPQNILEEMADLKDGYPVFRESLNLIINGLCYLSAYPDDIKSSWPEDTPKSLIDKINKATKVKEIQRTTSKLTSMGYTKIHYCGKAFENILNKMSDGANEVRAHWRRGHWRNQPYGSQLTSRKVIWIMPILVRKDKDLDIQDTGHIYLCNNINE